MYRRILSFMLLAVLSVGYAARIRAQALNDSVRFMPLLDSSAIVRGFPNPNLFLFSFNHLLSIYEWHERSNLSTSESPVKASADGSNIDTVQLRGDSRLLQYNSIRSNSVTAFVYADEAISSTLRPMILFSGSSIASSGVPGLSAATLVPGETDGFGAGGIRYFWPGTNLDLSGSAGIAEQKQSGVSTAVGPIVRVTAADPFESVGDGALFMAGGIADERFFRQNSERYSSDSISAAISNPIGSGSLLDSNHAWLNANLDRRDFFYTTDSGSTPIKQEWRELGMSIRDSINYPLSSRAYTATIMADLEPSSIERTSDITAGQLTANSFSAVSSLLVPNQESILHSMIGGRLDAILSPQWSMQGRMSYDDRTENVQLSGGQPAGLDPSLLSKFTTILNESSYEQRITQAGASCVYQPSERERFQIGTDANLLNYDTPSPLNDDDHDELITSAALRYERYFSDNLRGWFDLRAARTHLVYLLSDRSAQNNVTQSLTLSTHGEYATPAVYARADGEVFANYTTLDFLDSVPILQGVGNYVMRGLILSDTISSPLDIRPFESAGPISVHEGALLQISERGSYDASAFSEVVSSRITQLSGSLTLGLTSVHSSAPWRVQAGVKAFFLFNDGQSSLQLETVPVFQELERQTRIGPVISISLLRWGGTGPMLVGSLWYSVLNDQSFENGTVVRTPQTEAQLSAQWTF